jgi:hypothetical protein
VPDVRYPAIPEPNLDINALLNTVKQLKEAVELMTGQRGSQFSFANQTKTLQRQFGNASAKFTQQIKVLASSTGASTAWIATFESNFGVNGADIATEFTTQAGVNSAQATMNTTLSAGVADATASGQIRLVATAAPSGVTASYAIELQTTTLGVWAQTGLYLDLIGGVSRLRIVVDQFHMTDPGYNGGDATEVFAYDSGDGVFRFFVPVEIITDEIALNAVTNAASDVQTVAGGANFDIVITTLANSPVTVIMVFSDPTGATSQSGLSTFGGTNTNFDVKYDGVSLDSVNTIHPVYARAGGGTFSTAMQPVPFVGRIPAGVLAAGPHTIRVANPTGVNLKMAGIVLETKR